MKDRIRVAKRALRKVKSISVPLEPMMNLDGSQGLVLGDMKFSAKVSRNEMLGLLLSTTYNEELFYGMKVEGFDLFQVARKLTDQLINRLWPRKGLYKRWFYHQGIEELKPLTQELDEMRFSLKFDKADAKDVVRIREQLNAIKDGRYTFLFCVSVYVGMSRCRYCDANEEEIETPWRRSNWCHSCDYELPVKLKATAQEVLGFLYNIYPYKNLFDGICEEPLDINYFYGKIGRIPWASEVPLLLVPSPNGPKCVLVIDLGLLVPHLNGRNYMVASIMRGDWGYNIYDDWYFDSYMKYFDEYLATCDPNEPVFFIDDYYGLFYS